MWEDYDDDDENTMNQDSIETSTPLLEVKDDFLSVNGQRDWKPKQRWLFVLPPAFEDFLKGFDDTIIHYVQHFHSPALAYFDLFITAIVAIETGIAAPYVLYILGFDGLATELSYLMLLLALFSQIPKRFLWRYRPYMAGRALKLRKKETAITSSFPSRAVTCAVVYSFVIIYAYLYKIQFYIYWWMPILMIAATLLSSFSRINLGVHYPSDCLFGFLQGIVVCILGTLLWHVDTLGCSSCFDRHCYTKEAAFALTKDNFVHNFNFVVLFVGVIIATIITVVSVMKPIDFWSKCDRVYGMLVPGIIFQLTCLCPDMAGTSLMAPKHIPWYGYFYAFGLVGIATGLQLKNNGKYPIVVFLSSFVILYTTLVVWRVWVM